MVQKSRLAPTICEDCGKVFKGGPFSYFCPKCRKKRLCAAAKAKRPNNVKVQVK